MAKVPRVTAASAFSFSSTSNQFSVSAVGEVPTSGFTNPRLSPYFYVTPPNDGMWDFDFLVDEPSGIVLQVVLPMSASRILGAPNWLKGVRIHGATNKVEAQLVAGKPVLASAPAFRFAVAAGNIIYRQDIASYDDSFQPIGMCNWNSVRMKKLHHTLTLTAEGPDQGQIQHCIAQAAAAGLIAAIVAAFVTGGAALSAAISAFLTSLKTCLGDAFTARIDDHSEWIEWCT